VAIISIGSNSVDKLLGGGIRTGFVSEILGNSKYARNVMSVSACINAVRMSSASTVIFMDTQGNFRPEMALDTLMNSEDRRRILNKILTVRIYSLNLFSSMINKSISRSPQMIVIDNFVSLFTSEFQGIKRHLSLMHRLRELATTALDHDLAILITNPSAFRSPDSDSYYVHGINSSELRSPALSFHADILGTSLSTYTSFVLKVDRLEMKDGIYSVKLIKPANNSIHYFRIVKGSIYELVKS
jgi:RecA/RadA recombinase